MSEITADGYNQIVTQSDLISKTVRDNFTTVVTAINDNNSEIENLSASTSTSEIISARDEFTTLQARLHATQKLLGNGVINYQRTIDACDAVDEWTAGTGATATAIDTSNFLEGTGSLKMGKSTTSTTDVDYTLNMSPVSYEDNYIKFDLFITNSTALAKLDDIHFDITPDTNFATNYKRFTLANLVVGWNPISFEINSPTSTIGTVANDDTIQKGRVYIVTNNNADTLTAGDLLIDYIRFIGSEFKIKAQDTPDLTVQALAGQAIVNGYAIEKTAAQNSGSISAPSANPRKDLVTININGTIQIFTGAEAASPSRPWTPYNHIALAEIYNRVGQTSIKDADDSTNGYITDLRSLQSDHPIFLSGSGVPIGTIIATHPDVLSGYRPDDIGDNYEPCDGVASLPTAYFNTSNDTKVPNLTDDIFLQGATSFDKDLSGSNIVNLQHSHTNTHNHQWAENADSWESDGSTKKELNDTLYTFGTAGGFVYYEDYWTKDEAITTSSSLSVYQDIRPKYFNVKYYIRLT